MAFYEITFSATGRTLDTVRVISDAWEGVKTHLDLTDPAFDGSGAVLAEGDVCLVAVGVYGGRVPAPAARRLRTLRGNGAAAILTAVYGNRAVDDCLLELKDILTEGGFRCVAAVEAVAEHSIMPRFGAGRPDERDRLELTDFARKIRAGLEDGSLTGPVEVPGNRPYVQAHNLPLKFKADSKCTKCGKCARLCPAGAIPKEDPASVDTEKCIRCMRCTTVCPVNARHLPGWMGLAAPLMAGKLGGRKENKLYL